MSSSSIRRTNHQGGVVRVPWPTLNFGAPMIFLERLKPELSNFAHTRRLYQILAYVWQTTSKRGVVMVIWPIFNFDACTHISGMAEAIVAKLFMQVDVNISLLALGWQTTPRGHGQGQVTRFLKFRFSHMFGIGAARHFKFCKLIDTQECWCMRDSLPPKEMCSESRDLFKFWKISDTIR